MSQSTLWTTPSLHEALSGLDAVRSGRIVIQPGQAEQPGIRLHMTEYGDLPIYIGICGEQILVDTTLVEVARVRDTAAFDRLVLRSRDLFPLSSVGIETLADGTEVYCMFGALSAASALALVEQEILTLADNVIHAVEAFEDHFVV
ncbi:DUF2170 family protein [Pseudomonas japonica]|uniref:DUF2170 family protein n=1 Tax=Pseudomonas japonica TaxID=256466 RepID=UPI0038161AE6